MLRTFKHKGQTLHIKLTNTIQKCVVQARYEDDEDDDGPAADPQLEGGMPLPIRMAAEFPPEFTAIPLEDMDPFYQNKKVNTVLLLRNEL